MKAIYKQELNNFIKFQQENYPDFIVPLQEWLNSPDFTEDLFDWKNYKYKNEELENEIISIVTFI